MFNVHLKPPMTLHSEYLHHRLSSQTRRHFLGKCSVGLGALWLAAQAGRARASGGPPDRDPANPLAATPPPFPARAKRVIYLHMAGSPSQLELFDHKPELAKLDGVSLNQFIAAAVAEKVGSIRTARDFLHERAGSAKPMDMMKYLRRAPKVAPTAGDER